MRGNEQAFVKQLLGIPAEFPIPMRGNEVRDKTKPRGPDGKVSDPHEG